ncbi:MAG: hypothetical protein ABEJ27_05710 [Halodesulfurarchaeum sp.]
MSHATSAVVILKAVSLALGALITYFAARAHGRTGSNALRALAVGFGLVTIGALVAGVLDQLLIANRTLALLVESGFTTLGFAVIFYSLYVD